MLGRSRRATRRPAAHGLVAQALDRRSERAARRSAEAHPDWKHEARLRVLREPGADRREPAGGPRAAWAEPFTADRAADRRHPRARLRRCAPPTADARRRSTSSSARPAASAGCPRSASAGSSSPRPTSAGRTTSCWPGRTGGSSAIRSPTTRSRPTTRSPPPQAVVRLHRALGDETRLRILKLLAGRDLYLTEIAQQLDLSKPTIKHHLALLRAAGLVTDHGVGHRHLLQPPPQPARRRLGRHQAVPHRLGASPTRADSGPRTEPRPIKVRC